MDITTSTIYTRHSGVQTILDLPAGKNVRIETSPAGIEVFNLTVPVGKKWDVLFLVSIVEKDA